MAINISDEYANYPWLVFKLQNVEYAVNCRYVTSILGRPKDMADAVQALEYVVGLMNIRGEILPLMDSRVFFGMKSKGQEENEFSMMIEALKQQHIRWLGRVADMVKTRELYDMAQDEDYASIQKWMASQGAQNTPLAQHYKSLDSMYKKMEKGYKKVLDCLHIGTVSEEDVYHFDTLKVLQEELELQVMQILDEAITIFAENYIDLVFTLRDDDSYVGYTMDEVLAVEALEIINVSKATKGMEKSRYLYGIGKRKNTEKVILLLDDVPMLKIMGLQ